jgi:hypothetical protein
VFLWEVKLLAMMVNGFLAGGDLHIEGGCECVERALADRKG